jgi:hypothetical protein
MQVEPVGAGFKPARLSLALLPNAIFQFKGRYVKISGRGRGGIARDQVDAPVLQLFGDSGNQQV